MRMSRPELSLHHDGFHMLAGGGTDRQSLHPLPPALSYVFPACVF